jgi:hypothetical protein
MSKSCMFTNTTPINQLFLFQLHAHTMLNTHKYHQLPSICCRVCYTICRETFVLLGIKRSDWLQECMEWKASYISCLGIFFTHLAIFRNAVTIYNDSLLFVLHSYDRASLEKVKIQPTRCHNNLIFILD